ncbi:hypothetical protein M0804_013660 [Polistes exclamans]|nr:hypothetical protein M0804_013660 [Polistes exclamans]
MRSDKGNNTVIMKKEEYLNEMHKKLQNKDIYQLLNKDPTSRFEKLANNLIMKLRKESSITEEIEKSIKSYNSVALKIYGIIPFLKVYVDDIITAIPKDGIEVVLKTFNMINERIQFTIEIEDNGSLPFLDVTVIRNKDRTISTNWYRKPTSSGRCINYYSNHPLSQKIGTIKGLLFRALTLRSNKFHTDNKKKIETLIENNIYPMSLIRMVFNEFKIDKDRIKNPNPQDKKYIKFPYIKPLVNKINKCFKNTNIKLVFYNLTKINSI